MRAAVFADMTPGVFSSPIISRLPVSGCLLSGVGEENPLVISGGTEFLAVILGWLLLFEEVTGTNFVIARAELS